jgi:hypothetical protein
MTRQFSDKYSTKELSKRTWPDFESLFLKRGVVGDGWRCWCTYNHLTNIVIGLNPRAELIGFFTDRIVQGTVSIGIGANKGIGGTNETQFGHEETLRKPTLTVDGYKLVDEGKIQA